MVVGVVVEVVAGVVLGVVVVGVVVVGVVVVIVVDVVGFCVVVVVVAGGNSRRGALRFTKSTMTTGWNCWFNAGSMKEFTNKNMMMLFSRIILFVLESYHLEVLIATEKKFFIASMAKHLTAVLAWSRVFGLVSSEFPTTTGRAGRAGMFRGGQNRSGALRREIAQKKGITINNI